MGMARAAFGSTLSDLLPPLHEAQTVISHLGRLHLPIYITTFTCLAATFRSLVLFPNMIRTSSIFYLGI